MPSARLSPDRSLVARMLLTMLLIGLLHAGVLVALLLLMPWAWPVVLVVFAALFVGELWFGSRLSAVGTGAREVDAQEAPELHATLDRLCALTGAAKPKVALIDTDLPNAFATGRDHKHSVVFVTTGLQRRLSPEELEAVLAHELSHIAHRDAVVMTVAGFLGLLAGAVARVGAEEAYFDDWDAEGAILGIAWFVITAVNSVVYSVSFLLTGMLSRQRELSADRAAAITTGRPSVLASALVKVQDEMSTIPDRDLRRARSLDAFSFVPAASGRAGGLLSSHPSMRRRLDQLEQMTVALSKP